VPANGGAAGFPGGSERRRPASTPARAVDDPRAKRNQLPAGHFRQDRLGPAAAKSEDIAALWKAVLAGLRPNLPQVFQWFPRSASKTIPDPFLAWPSGG